MNGDQIFNSINNIQISIKNHKEEIEKLDQEIGDGDHIFNILRGLDEILNLKEELNVACKIVSHYDKDNKL